MLNATERKVLTVSAFVAACICFAPGDVVSGTVLILASFALLQYDHVMLRREAESAPEPAAAPDPPTPAAPAGEESPAGDEQSAAQ